MQAVPVNTQPNFSFVPTEILEHHILCWLSLPSLIACLLSCTRLQKIARKIIETKTLLAKSTISACSEVVLKLLFEEGATVQFAKWFQRCLHYPVFDMSQNPFCVDCLCLAAKGSDFFF